VNDLRVERNIWSGAAVAMVAAALVALVSVLTGPYSVTDQKIQYSLVAALLGAAAFFSSRTLLERKESVVAIVGMVTSLGGLALFLYSIWEDRDIIAGSEGAFWGGVITLVTVLVAIGAQLVAVTPLGRWVAAAAGVTAVVAAAISLDTALSHEPFWTAGSRITISWTIATLLLFLVPVLERGLARSRFWLLAGVGLVAVAVVAVAELLSGFSPDGYRIFFTLIAAVAACGAALAGIVCVERGARVIGFAALGLSPLCLWLIADGIWRDSDDRFRLVWTGGALLAALLISLLARLLAGGRAVVVLAGVSAVFAGLAAAISIEHAWSDEVSISVEKVVIALWLVATLCCVLVPLLERSLVVTRTSSEAGQ
jgi:hypothetical protein